MERRPAHDDEFDEVFALHEAAFREHIERIWGKWDARWQRDNFAREWSECTCEVVVSSAGIVGYLQYELEPESVRVRNIALRPEHRNAGLGTSILRDLQHHARSRDAEVRLRVFPTNISAQRLYARLGFREVARDRAGIDLVWRER